MEIPATEKERKALKVGDIRVLLEGAGIDAKGTKPTLLERVEEVRLDRISILPLDLNTSVAASPRRIAPSGRVLQNL
jgi:hypothetical protein